MSFSSHQHSLASIARAIESQCFVIAAAQHGRHNKKRESYGHSIAIGPWGEVLADAGGVDSEETPDAPKVVFCDLDLAQISDLQKRMPIQEHREKSSFS